MHQHLLFLKGPCNQNELCFHMSIASCVDIINLRVDSARLDFIASCVDMMTDDDVRLQSIASCFDRMTYDELQSIASCVDIINYDSVILQSIASCVDILTYDSVRL
eukprot:TRINITY_DN7974_c0_g1_i8.p1 TRINITY_DN7974_c0_g1~~TRINITY_DN7974_c0_g1_i8.p1  ORF type:complete len:106 (+),score=11.63 TRINITY_DN7974_c0_g1_i8:83-400(+)